MSRLQTSLSAGLVLSMTLAGCSVIPMQGAKTRITSEPSGATVYSGPLKLGVTPLVIKPDEAFPPAWHNRAYQASGVLILRKPGCEEYNQKVSDALLSKPIHIKLKCDPTKATAGTVPVVQPASKPMQPASPKPMQMHKPVTSPTIEQRLKRLDSLYKKGLINQDEYKKARARILNEL